VYTVRLASNEKFSLKIKRTIKIIAPLLLIITTYITFSNQIIESIFSIRIKNFYNIYSLRIIRITSSTIVYLLLTLIVVVKITSKFKGPMRNILFKK